jgi:acyl-ACP thioesterase
LYSFSLNFFPHSNSILGSAFSRWILYDIHRNRPVRVPSEIAEAFMVNGGKDNQSNSITLPEVEVADSYEPGLEFRVRLSDIDTYNHVNNTRYVEWILEAVPFKIHQEFYPASLEISYRKSNVQDNRTDRWFNFLRRIFFFKFQDDVSPFPPS